VFIPGRQKLSFLSARLLLQKGFVSVHFFVIVLIK